MVLLDLCSLHIQYFSFNVKSGECFGLIGVNGAGKSTTFKMIIGSLKPNIGDIALAADRIGYCPQQNSIDSFLTTSRQLQVQWKSLGVLLLFHI